MTSSKILQDLGNPKVISVCYMYLSRDAEEQDKNGIALIERNRIMCGNGFVVERAYLF